MSDIDRRRYNAPVGYDCMADMEEDPNGEWFHESAVRELVGALKEAHLFQTTAPLKSVCASCDLLTHYRDLDHDEPT